MDWAHIETWIPIIILSGLALSEVGRANNRYKVYKAGLEITAGQRTMSGQK